MVFFLTVIILAFLTKHCQQASPFPSHVASSLTPFCPFHSLTCPPGSRVGGLWWRCWVQSEVLLKNGFQNSRYVSSSSLSPSARRWRDVPLEAVFYFWRDQHTVGGTAVMKERSCISHLRLLSWTLGMSSASAREKEWRTDSRSAQEYLCVCRLK